MANHKMGAWSHSSLSSFETCPKKFYHTRVVKDTPDPPGEAALWGSEAHKKLENRLAKGTPLPDYLSNCEPIVQQIMNKNGKRLVEEQIALTEDLRPTSWFAKDVWCRGVIDAGVVNEKRAVLLDWKFGKRKPDSEQMKLFAAFSFAAYPWIEKVTTAFVWIKDNKVDKEEFTKDDVPIIWQETMPRITRVKQAYERDSWPAKPSGLCKKHCPVRSCEFNGK